MTIPSISYSKTYRSEIYLKTINNGLFTKDEILQRFLDLIPKSTADSMDYLNYMFTFIFSRKDNNNKLNGEQKECIKYLCSNGSTFFSKNVTRGQIKLWYVIYYLHHDKIPADFNTLVDWILYEKVHQGGGLREESTSFSHDLQSAESYFDSIHQSGEIIFLGYKGYKSCTYNKSKLFPATIDPQRYVGHEGYQRLIFDNMVDPDKYAELKKKLNIP